MHTHKTIEKMRHLVNKPLTAIWNKQLVENKIFPSKLKLSDITPVHKALENTLKKNYRPISVLPIISKLFEKIMDKQTDGYIY